MTAARRAVLRQVPPGGTVLVAGPVPDDVVAALAARGDRLVASDAAEAARLAAVLGRAQLAVAEGDTPVAVLRPRGAATLPDAGTVVTDLVLAGPEGTDVAALRALARAGVRRGATLLLVPADEGGVRWVARWDSVTEEERGAARGGAGAVVLEALTAGLDLLGAELAAGEEALGAERWRVGDRTARLRAAERATTTAQAAVEDLAGALERAEERAHEALRDVRGPVLERPVGRTEAVVRALRGDTGPPATTSPRPPTQHVRPTAPAAGLTGPASGLRVSVLGDDALPWCAGAVRVRQLPPPSPDDAPPDAAADGAVAGDGVAVVPPLAIGHDHVEALVVGPRLPAGWDTDAATALLGRARHHAVPVLGVRPAGGGVAWFDGLVDAELGPATDPGGGPGAVAAAQPVPATAVTGQGFRRAAADVAVVVPAGPLAPGTAAALRSTAATLGPRGAAPDAPLVLLAAGADAAHAGLDDLAVERVAALPDGDVARATAELPALLQRLRRHRCVLDHPGLHADPGAHAHWLGLLALARVPVLLAAPLPVPVAALLGPALTAALAGTAAADLDDQVARERRTVLALRAAWQRVTPAATWRRAAPALGLPGPRHPTVSMVLATNRPDHVLHAVAQAGAQRWPARELVVVLHGPAFDDGWEARVAAAAEAASDDLPLVVRRADGALPLGAVLNLGCEAAGGDLVTKVDDDDWYSPDHLVDLLAAREQSGAHLVGKAAEFTYLAELDLTVRRMADGGGSASRSIAGGTFLLGRDELWDAGGWPHVPRFVDQRLIDALLEAGGRLHRTHGFGYVLNRHGTGHTWDAGADYFLRQAVTQHRGLALDVAGVADDDGAPT